MRRLKRAAVVFSIALPAAFCTGVAEAGFIVEPEFSVSFEINNIAVPLTTREMVNENGGGTFTTTLDLAQGIQAGIFEDVDQDFVQFVETGDLINKSFRINGETNPILAVGFGVVDSSDPSTFAVSAVSPVIPTLSGGAISTGSVEGNLADGSEDGSVSLVAGAGITPMLLSTFVNGTPRVDVGADFSSSVMIGGSVAYPSASQMQSFMCPPADCSTFGLSLIFEGAGGDDGYSFTARHDLVSADVPEPATIALFGVGLAGLGVAARRKRRYL